MSKKITMESLRRDMEIYREERHALIDRMVAEKQYDEDLSDAEAEALREKLKRGDLERRP